MALPDALQYIYDLQRFGIKFGLSNTNMILQAMSNPHLKLNCIHISGTNGKGSTAAMISSILQCAGFKVGLYISPHFIDITERIQINSTPVSKGDFLLEAKKIRGTINKLNFTDTYPTYFEVLTCIAFSYFYNQRVDFAILEVGMGGRLDATNICKPVVAVITNISFDHQQYLGNTLEEIAKEKAGIIKSGVPLVCGITQREVLEIIKKECESKGALFFPIYSLYHIEEFYPEISTAVRSESSPGSQKPLEMGKMRALRVCREGRSNYLDIKTSLLGRFQIQNSLLAIETIERIRDSGINISDETIKIGLHRAKWPGRMQIVSKGPYIVLDGAHNPAAAQSLADTIRDSLEFKEIILVIGIMGDKDIAGIFDALLPIAKKLILTAPKYERAAPVDILIQVLKKGFMVAGKEILTSEGVPDALQRARELADPQGLILVTGSLYTIGEAMAALGIKPYPETTGTNLCN